MPDEHFVAADVAGLAIAFVLFSGIAFFPGYVLAWALDLWQFRRRTLLFQFAAAIPLAISLGPVFSFCLANIVPLKAVPLAYLFISSFGIVPLLRYFRFQKQTVIACSIALCWCLFTMAWLSDWKFGQKLYFPIYAFDYSVRSAMVHTLSVGGLPAQTPFFFPGHPVALRYHFLWFLQPALINATADTMVTARIALIAGTAWSGLGLICTLALYLRVFSPAGQTAIRRRVLIGTALLAVTGLDIVPALGLLLANHLKLIGTLPPSVEWWNDQVDGWIFTMLWEPHYICGLVACLIGFLLVWQVSSKSSRIRCFTAAALAGLSFATAVGSGIFVALLFACFLTLWTVFTIIRKCYREATTLAGAGIIALVFSAVFLQAIRSASANSGPGLLSLTIRAFYPLEMVSGLFDLNPASWQVKLADLAALPFNYFLEFGAFFAAGYFGLRRFFCQRRSPTRYECAVFGMTTVSIVVCTFVKSGATPNNDLGWRGMLIAQFMLLILAADLLGLGMATLKSGHRRLLSVLLLLGVCGTIYDLLLLRFYPMLSDAGAVPKLAWLAKDDKLGARTYANRQAYEWLKRASSPSDVIQQNPGPVYMDVFYGLYADRRTAAGDTSCTIGFGGQARECKPLVDRFVPLYSNAPLGPSAFDEACDASAVQFFIAKDTDGSWHNPASWVWNRTPVYANSFVRIFSCADR